jgi:hypothetical protein
MEHMTEEAKALLSTATGQVAEKLLSPTAAMPLTEELEAELCGDFLKQTGDVVVIDDANHCATR